jgi:hypothetical protein
MFALLNSSNFSGWSIENALKSISLNSDTIFAEGQMSAAPGLRQTPHCSVHQQSRVAHPG